MPGYCAPWPVKRKATSGARGLAHPAGDGGAGRLTAER